MSWLSKKLHKSAKKNTGIFSWGGSIPGVGEYINKTNELLDKDADKKGFYQDTPEKMDVGMASPDKNIGLIVLALVAYYSGIF